MGNPITEYKLAKVIFLEASDILLTDEMQQLKNFTQHGTTTVFEHCVSVAKFSLILALNYQRLFKRKLDLRSLIRGALLHDYFLYDWHEKHAFHKLHGFTHPNTSWLNANRDFNMNEMERDIIRKHMFPLTLIPPRHVESSIVCMADKWCAICETFKIDLSSIIVERINQKYKARGEEIL